MVDGDPGLGPNWLAHAVWETVPPDRNWDRGIYARDFPFEPAPDKATWAPIVVGLGLPAICVLMLIAGLAGWLS